MLPSSPSEELPQLHWLDARGAGVDPDGLRGWARELSAAGRRTHSSRSYSYPYAVVALHDAPVGVDIERIGPLDADFGRAICAPDEPLEPPTGVPREHYLTSLWSSKEALAKALGDALDYDPRRLHSPQGWPGGRSGRWRARELDAGPDHVAWLCWSQQV